MEQPYKILLVDDDFMFNYLHKRELGKYEKFMVTRDFLSALDALDFIKSGENAGDYVILLDINMPGMNGWEFLELFSKLPDGLTNGYRIIMLSSSVSSEDVARSQQYRHVHGYLFKPLEVKMLTDILDRL